MNVDAGNEDRGESPEARRRTNSAGDYEGMRKEREKEKGDDSQEDEVTQQIDDLDLGGSSSKGRKTTKKSQSVKRLEVLERRLHAVEGCVERFTERDVQTKINVTPAARLTQTEFEDKAKNLRARLNGMAETLQVIITRYLLTWVIKDNLQRFALVDRLNGIIKDMSLPMRAEAAKGEMKSLVQKLPEITYRTFRFLLQEQALWPTEDGKSIKTRWPRSLENPDFEIWYGDELLIHACTNSGAVQREMPENIKVWGYIVDMHEIENRNKKIEHLLAGYPFLVHDKFVGKGRMGTLAAETKKREEDKGKGKGKGKRQTDQGKNKGKSKGKDKNKHSSSSGSTPAAPRQPFGPPPPSA